MIIPFIHSMTARIFLIVLGGTIVSGALVMGLAHYERKELVTQIRAHHASEKIEQTMLALEAAPAASRPALAAMAEKSGIHMAFADAGSIQGPHNKIEVSAELMQIFELNRSFSVYEQSGADCPAKRGGKHRLRGVPHCQIFVTNLKDGTPVRFDIPYHDADGPPFRGPFLLNLLEFLLAISILALVVAYVATKPLRRLAQAARDLGHNIEQPPLPENQGSKEVREASQAFNSMQTSIRNHIKERTFMLAAIAHDLQTPLTRLRLRLEKVSDEALRTQLVADLTASQVMIREGLEFARSMNAEEPFEPLDLDSLLEAICNDALDAGCDVSFSGSAGKPILACPRALRHCISNLLDNALKYGKSARIEVKREASKVLVSIRDFGPGIPEAQLEAVFQPFKRLEDSRSRDTGGTGLGLTIARIIAEKHKGSLKLVNLHPIGSGLLATLELPVDAEKYIP